jgi:hypothetical protein
MALALLGLLLEIRRATIQADSVELSRIVVLGALYGMFWAGLFYHILVTYIALGLSSSTGCYMYAVVIAEMLLTCCGLQAFAGRRWPTLVLPAVAAAFASLDLYGVHALLVPYYTGLIAHVPGTDVVHPATFSQLVGVSPSLILQRLAVNKPAILGASVFGMLFVLYYAATIATVVVSYLAFAPIQPAGKA